MTRGCRSGWPLVLSLLVAGCTSLLEPGERFGADSPAVVTSSGEDLGELLNYASVYGTLTDAEREGECQRLKRRFKREGGWQIGQALVYVIVETPACGTLKEAMAVLNAIERQHNVSDQQRWLAKYLSLFVKRQLEQHNRYQRLEHAYGKVERRTTELSKKNRALEAELEELSGRFDALQIKLDALKAIETSINRRLDDAQNDVE